MSDAARANSRFTVVADVSDGTIERRTVATGRDIYGITAPMIVGAAQALLSEKGRAFSPSAKSLIAPACSLASSTRTTYRSIAMPRRGLPPDTQHSEGCRLVQRLIRFDTT